MTDDLEKLYNSVKGWKELGLPIGEKESKLIDEKEEELIKTEILPALTKDIEPRLSRIQRELVLVVEYKPDENIRVSISRKTNINELIQAKRLEADPQVEHKEGGPRKKKVSNIAPKTVLCIHRKNGSILQEHNAASTFVAAIKEAGLRTVRSLGFRHCGINIVSTTKDKKYGSRQQEVEPGLYVLTHSSTNEKKKMLEKINSALKMGWRVEIVTSKGFD